MDNRQLLLAGTIGGLALALGLAALFSILTAASAQMMQHQGMDMSSMGSGMAMSVSMHQSKMFSGSGHSAVSNVQVTGIAITGDNEATVYLKYTGAGAAPSVVIVAHTNRMDMMSMMHGGMPGTPGMGMMNQGGGMMGSMSSMQGTSYPAWSKAQWHQWHTQMAHQLATTNSTQWQGWHDQIMMNPTLLNSTSTAPQASNLQVGSAALSAGWKNGAFKVKMQGDGSAYDASDIMAMVFPLTS
jgi:hypothetical protein